MVVLSLMQKQSLIVPQVAIARLHCSSPVFAKSKKSNNKKPNSIPSNNAKRVPAPNSISPQPKPQVNEAPSGASSSEVPPSSDTPSPSQPVPESASPSTDQQQATASPPPADAVNPNPIHDEQYKAYRGKQATGPFTWKAAALFLLTGTGLIIYFRMEKERMDRLRISSVCDANSRGCGGKQINGNASSWWALQSYRSQWKQSQSRYVRR